MEWTIKAQLEEWAEVASFDAPGVGSEPAAEDFGPASVARRGLIQLDRLGWTEFILIADEYGALAGIRIADSRQAAVKALAVGHACLTNEVDGDRASIDGEMHAAMARLIRADYRMWVRHLTQLTQGAYDDEFAERYIELVPQQLAEYFYGAERPPNEPLEERLRALEAPMLFAKHDGCLLHTDEGFADLAAAFPEARTMSSNEKPSTSAAFASAIKDLCRNVGLLTD